MKAISNACLAVLATLAAGPVHAAQQGSMGAMSQGSIEIRVTVAPRVRLSVAPEAPVMQAASSGGPVSESRAACLWSNTPTRRFRLVSAGSANESAAIGAGAAQAACTAAGGTSASVTLPGTRARLQRASMQEKLAGPRVLLVVPE